MNTSAQLLSACVAQALLTFGVGLVMLRRRVQAMRTERIRPQAVALSAQRNARFADSRASDNYNHLFELPTLFYALCAMAPALQFVPEWLPWGAWLFVILRFAHSAIQISYNGVVHRFTVFLAGYLVLMSTWLAYGVAYLGRMHG